MYLTCCTNFVMIRHEVMIKNICTIKEVAFLVAFSYFLKVGGNSSIWEETVCPSLLITLNLNELSLLRNCTKIEGNLQIVRIENIESPSVFDDYHFPKLREITGFLILYRVNKLQSLSQLFPNLSIIRGETLLYNYALVIYEMQDLEEVNLSSLTKIIKGGIRVEHNPRLCYLDTIHWSYIINDGENIYFYKNKSPSGCIDSCLNQSNDSNSCPVVEVTSYGKKTFLPRCWNFHHCQKICPQECGSSSCYSVKGKLKCCHSQCIGGCLGPNNTECSACIGVFHNKTCLPGCPPGTLKFKGRWCLTQEECIRGGKWYKRSKILNDQCLDRCPTGYTSNQNETYKCIKCTHRCPKECSGVTIESISSAQMLKGCTIIKGNLEIQIRGGNQIAYQLEENLGSIEEVKGYVKVFKAHSLMSLRFLKNIRVVHGEQLFNVKYAIVVLDNHNLQDIWDFGEHPNLTIGNGGQVYFHYNGKLCLSKISRFVESIGRNFSDVSELDISMVTNGDQIPCDMMSLVVNISSIDSRTAHLDWYKTAFPDDRQILGYMVYHRKVLDNENVTIYSRRDACETDIWKTEVIKQEEVMKRRHLMHLLQNLEPYTKYVYYVETYSISSSKMGAISPLIFFKTKPETPSPPRDLVITSNHPNELVLKWSSPSNPFGIVTHYYVYWLPNNFEERDRTDKNHCEERLFPAKQEETMSNTDNVSETNQQGCCTCEKYSKEKLDLESESFERHQQINFQNYLQNIFYLKKGSTEQTRSKRHLDESNQLNVHRHYLYNTSKEILNISSKLTEAAIVSNRTEVTLTNLGHYQEYNIEVVACHDYDPEVVSKLCSPTVFGIGMTLEKRSADDIDPDKVNHTVVHNSDSELFITWLPPASPNGMILLYEVELDKPGHEQKRTSCIPQKRYGQVSGAIIKGLASGNWSYKIRATSRAGVGSWTKTFYAYVPHTAPNLAISVGAPLVCAVLSACLIGVLIYLYIQRNKYGRGLGYRISHNPNYLLPGDVYTPDEWEVDRSKVTLLKELGSGSFGKVFEGTVRNLVNMPSIMRVAIKSTHRAASNQDIICFLNEASRMKVFENGCNHVVKLYGVVSQGKPPYVIMELMSNGDLREYLRSCRSDSQGSENRNLPTLKQILRMVAEIADGMSFLESKNYVHRDLASRNCLVSEDSVVKIADFGMTRDIYMTDYYRKGGHGMLPVRWMPKESVQDGYFDHKSDVWSYGVVLWEIVTLGHQPYMGLTNEQVCEFVMSGGCPNLPEGCHPILADLMGKCWVRDSKQRVSFGEILQILKSHLHDFLEVSFYFTAQKNHLSEILEKQNLCESDESANTSNIPLKHMQPNGDVCDESTNIKDITPLMFSYRGFPLPIELCKPLSCSMPVSQLPTAPSANNSTAMQLPGDALFPPITSNYINKDFVTTLNHKENQTLFKEPQSSNLKGPSKFII